MNSIFSKKALSKEFLANEAFKKSKIAQVVQWVTRTDGVSQYWQLSEPIVIPANKDFRITQTILGTNNSFEGLLDSTDSSFWLRLMPTSQGRNIQGWIIDDYISSVPHSDVNLRDGNYHTVTLSRVNGVIYVIYDGNIIEEITKADGFNIHRLARFSTAEFGGVYKDFEVSIGGVLVNQIPLTNKGQGATQLATVGDVNAFMPNYSSDVWEVDSANS